MTTMIELLNKDLHTLTLDETLTVIALVEHGEISGDLTALIKHAYKLIGKRVPAGDLKVTLQKLRGHLPEIKRLHEENLHVIARLIRKAEKLGSQQRFPYGHGLAFLGRKHLRQQLEQHVAGLREETRRAKQAEQQRNRFDYAAFQAEFAATAGIERETGGYVPSQVTQIAEINRRYGMQRAEPKQTKKSGDKQKKADRKQQRAA